MKENDAIENVEVPNNSNNIKFQLSSQQQILANPKTILFFLYQKIHFLT